MSRVCRKANRSVRCPHGFTLVEALVSITIAAIAASALSLGLTSALQTTDMALEETIATGMAMQLIDEAMGKKYVTGGDPYQVYLGPSAWEQQGSGRERYDDTDDYHGFQAQPPEDVWGYRLGRDDGAGGERHPNFFAGDSYLNHWEQQVEVYYVDNNDQSVRLPTGQTSNFRAIEVHISIIDEAGLHRRVASVRRVFGYVPIP